jgi:ubiquinone/menaquinone biosynthesis C-methylase UbiE
MAQRVDVTPDEILQGFDALADIYAHVPPLIMWRAWELAVYRHVTLPEPVLDVGCGDGRFFHRAFPSVADVHGVDQSAQAVEFARQSGFYRQVYHAPAHSIPAADNTFASAFANCSLEHMDELDSVLGEVRRVVRPGGVFLLSIVTDAFVNWSPLGRVLTMCGAAAAGRQVQTQHEEYHHLVNALPIETWLSRIDRAGLQVRQWTPVADGVAGWVSVLLDQLWHVPTDDAEMGTGLEACLSLATRRVPALRKIFAGLLELDTGLPPAGAVVVAIR